jgi:hypothetical protein
MGIARIAILKEINPVLKTPVRRVVADAFTCHCTAAKEPNDAAVCEPMKPEELLTCCGMSLNRNSRMYATTALACPGRL